MTRRPMIGVGAVLVAVVITVGIALGASSGGPKPGPSSDPSAPAASGSVASVPTPRPIPGHEVFGFVPYWEMNGDIAAHVAATDLTTLALFSVTHTKTGAIDTKQTGYKRITGDIGTQLIREAHDRGIHVQFVYSSFGTARNQTLFTR